MKIMERDSGRGALSRAVHLLVSMFASSRRMLSLMGTTMFRNEPLGLPARLPQVRPPSARGFPCAGVSLRFNAFDFSASGLSFFSFWSLLHLNTCSR